MQFKNPEILYALFLLLIPIFIHLFQLRRFKKIPFTNVDFLKKVSIQTRKSSRLKKWLTLLLRLLALASIIIAFAQPFLAANNVISKNQEVVIYLDNSFSMQAKGKNGVILKQLLQQLYDAPITTQNISWFTNTQTKRNTSLQDFKSQLLNTDFTYKQLPLKQVYLKAKQLFTGDTSAVKKLILLSDFQIQDGVPSDLENITVYVVQEKPEQFQNLSIDTLYIKEQSPENIELTAQISAQQKTDEIVGISVLNDSKLIAKSSVSFSEKTSQKINFEIENSESISGVLTLTDPTITYDNTLFFTIDTAQKINILAINQGQSNYLQRIFTPDEFNFTQQDFTSLDYSLINQQDFIILNELETPTVPLQNALVSFTKNGGTLLIIPSINSDLQRYNALFSSLNLPLFEEKINQERKISKINFSHPIYKDVFENQVTNFQYPTVHAFYRITKATTPLLQYEDQSPFIFTNNNLFVATAAFDKTNTNFKNSPLIVPTLYNIAKNSLAIPQLYYKIGVQNTIAVPTSLNQDQVLTIKDSLSSFIPKQKIKRTHVLITTTDQPEKAGNYGIYKNQEQIKQVSYNYSRTESTMRYHDVSQWENVKPFNSVNELFTEISNTNTMTNLWRWFVLAALLFLVLEMAVLKFFKQ